MVNEPTFFFDPTVAQAFGKELPVTRMEIARWGRPSRCTDGGIYTAAWEAGVAAGAWRGWWRIGDLVGTAGAPGRVVPEADLTAAVRPDGWTATPT